MDMKSINLLLQGIGAPQPAHGGDQLNVSVEISSIYYH